MASQRQESSRGMALPLMFQGTGSDVGKSVLVTAFCRLFARRGYRTAPFKSQNMALNSYITVDGKEIGRAQGVQAEAAGVTATTDMNPILIKPSREAEAQIVVHGRPLKNMKAGEYRTSFFGQGLAVIREAYTRLAQEYERIVIEGAGSPAEINLNDRELVNMRVARMADAPVILVADIERGGVFANLVGTLELLEPEDRERVIGVIINKFRGDLSLLEPGLDWFEKYTGKPVLGVLPYIHGLWIEAEDSVVLNHVKPDPEQEKDLDIAVVKLPMISNFTDIDPLMAETDCKVRYVTAVHELGQPDLIILPGSKNTIEDLVFVKKTGLANKIRKLVWDKKSIVFGICGGYQMLGRAIADPDHMETPLGEAEGLGLLPLVTRMARTKTTVRSRGRLTFDGQTFPVAGYEIHMGQSQVLAQSHGRASPLIQVEDRSDSMEKDWEGENEASAQDAHHRNEPWTDGLITEDGAVMGTYFHGIFHNDAFRWTLLNHLRVKKGLTPLKERVSFAAIREQAFDYLADEVEKHVQLERVEALMRSYQTRRRRQW
ncbi:adenosylcobyric acid synthase [Caldalkalibacillus uzonensis]|uniref:Cobyric acid synthase n=1 Tax=Caldalkalibacillus uzonensis TaxID=353224 RepID=A0ABU0CPS3_9BACI|nr:cobyric acid synthase [Caldalkalibacillus uzonensis]MDQ0338384.1 adenosylcobyric acid synthase [Caldalkalibacillus uzonensis]